MELKVVHYVDSEHDGKIVTSKHFIDGKLVSGDDFTDVLVGCIETDEDDEFEGFEECEDCNSDDCEGCEFNEDEDEDDDAEFNMICAWADAINDNDLCEACVHTVIQDAYMTGKKIGVRDSKLEMIENLSDGIEDMD